MDQSFFSWDKASVNPLPTFINTEEQNLIDDKE